MKCNSCSFIYKKIGGGVPTFNFSSGNPTGAIATTSRNRTKQLRILTEAGSTTFRYKDGIASTNSYIPLNCTIRVPYETPTCYNLPILNGGAPGSTFTYIVNGGNPSSLPSCFINGGTITTRCYTNPVLNGGGPNSTPFYYMDGNNPSSVASCFINGGHL
jgi:hypothetical protein